MINGLKNPLYGIDVLRKICNHPDLLLLLEAKKAKNGIVDDEEESNLAKARRYGRKNVRAKKWRRTATSTNIHSTTVLLLWTVKMNRMKLTSLMTMRTTRAKMRKRDYKSHGLTLNAQPSYKCSSRYGLIVNIVKVLNLLFLGLEIVVATGSQSTVVFSNTSDARHY